MFHYGVLRVVKPLVHKAVHTQQRVDSNERTSRCVQGLLDTVNVMRLWK